MKNILVLTRLFPDEFNKVKGVFVENLLNNQALDENLNFTVLVPIPYSNRVMSAFGGKAKPQWQKHSSFIQKPLYPVHYVRYFKAPGLYNIEWLNMLVATWLFIKRNRIRVDLIHTHWLYPDACAAIALAKLLKVKVVVHNHEAEIAYHTDHALIRRYLVFFLKQADLVIPVSYHAQQELLHNVGLDSRELKLNVIHNGVDTVKLYKSDQTAARKKVQFDENYINFLSVGTIKHKKGMDIALEALMRFSIDYPEKNIMWHIIGEGDQRETLNNLAIKHDFAQKIKFYGNLPYENISHYMNAADFFILPSRYESFGIVFLEALICGTPVLGTTVGGIPEFVTESSGVLIEKDDSQQCYMAILKLMSTEWNSEAISEFYTQNYSLRKFSKVINQIYNDLSG